MALKECARGTAFNGVICLTFDVSQPAWPRPMRAKDGAQNVPFIVQDDTDFAVGRLLLTDQNAKSGCLGRERLALEQVDSTRILLRENGHD